MVIGFKIRFIVILTMFISSIAYTQKVSLYNFNLDINLNFANKKRSYSVYSDNKYANSGYFWGFDANLYYKRNQYEYGIEFLPYRHFGVFVGRNLFDIKKYEKEFGITPNVKMGYSPLLRKVYYGGGVKFSYKWFHIGYNKTLHIKSGDSKYHGDGIDCFNLGVTLRISNSKEIPYRTTNDRGFIF